MTLLAVEGLSKRFGGLQALDDVTFDCDSGGILAIIGPNGAGKTTLFNCISGAYPPDRGRVLFKGENLAGWPANRICHQGVARTFQVVRTFGSLSVTENVMVGALCHTASVNQARAEARRIIESLGMAHKADYPGHSLTLADRKRCEIARALATKPELLMLDEVMAGLTPAEVREVVGMVKEINASGITILVIEHVMEAVMSLAQRIVVLNFGRKLVEGEPAEIVKDARVIKAYLGEKYHA